MAFFASHCMCFNRRKPPIINCEYSDSETKSGCETEAQTSNGPQTSTEPRMSNEPQTSSELQNSNSEPQTSSERQASNEPQTFSDPQTSSEPQTSRGPPERSKKRKKAKLKLKTKPKSSWLQKRLVPRTVFKWFRRDAYMSMTRIERTMKASLLIQKWYRRYMARLEFRRRYTWTIFQTLEYAGEQDQVKLYNFFNALLTHIPQTDRETKVSEDIYIQHIEFDDESPDEEYYEPEEKRKLSRYNLEYTEKSLIQLIEIFRKHRHYRLHAKVVANILQESIISLKRHTNVNAVNTGVTKQLTVCGDLHGKFDDLLVIFHKNGLPSPDNPYVFNGDFVDRGKRGLEVLLILLLCFLIIPGGVYLNRGNHEDLIMNQRYGFIREVQSKYKKNHEKLLRLIEGVYRYLPLATIVNGEVFIVHGGISDNIDMPTIKYLDRGRYVSLLRPPLSDVLAPGEEVIDKAEWKMVFDLLWSDPQDDDGCIPNTLRGAGTYFGPNVTKQFLEKNNFKFVIRSHECKAEGYEVCHDGFVITIFSASNYYEVGSNNGAYLKLIGLNLDIHFVQYMASSGKRKLNLYQRMGLVESGACKELRMQIMNNKDRLEEVFVEADPENTGYISITQWCAGLEKVTGLQLPWRMLKDKLVTINPDTNKVKYQSTFDVKNEKLNSVQGAHSVVETLYRNKKNLEVIFHIIDKDKSGYISLDEFSEACQLIEQFMPCKMTNEQLQDICKLMDLNKDGQVDLNEFLESFRMVDPQSRQKNSTDSPEKAREQLKNEAKTTDVEVAGRSEENTVNVETQPNGEAGASNNITLGLNIYPISEENYSCDDVSNVDRQKSPVLSSRRGSQI